MAEPKFKKGDYITNRKSKDIGIVKGVDKKGYYHFTEYYSGFYGRLKDASSVMLFFTYDQFFSPCNEEEVNLINDLVEKRKTEQSFA